MSVLANLEGTSLIREAILPKGAFKSPSERLSRAPTQSATHPSHSPNNEQLVLRVIARLRSLIFRTLFEVTIDI